MKVIHVMRTYFGKESCIGGGERYPTELAKAMVEFVDTKLISFGNKKEVVQLKPNLVLKIFPVRYFIEGSISNPFSILFLRELRDVDVVHCHSFNSFITNLCVIYSKIFKKKIFVTDLGGNDRNLAWYFDIGKYVDKFLVPSNFAVKHLMGKYRNKSEVIYGGVDTTRFKPIFKSKERKVLCVARYLPRKGQNYLIEAIPEKTKLNLIGQRSDVKYFRYLQKISMKKNVQFIENVTDDVLAREYSTALVNVLPSVYVDIYGKYSEVGELLGLTLLEAMACETPVICTNVGGMPEIVEDGKTGFIVPPNDVKSLRDRIEYFLSNPEEAYRMGRYARNFVASRYSIEKLANRCLDAYKKII